MQLYPAIDMLDGNAVRLRQGRRDDVTIFGNPVDLAAKWREQGATYLHLVDLTAAFDGQTKHLLADSRGHPRVRRKRRAGRRLRTMADIALRIEAGVTRCIIGTAAIEHPELVKEACRAFPGQIAVGLDAKDGFVATRGWVETSALTAAEVALRMRDMGVATLIYTDISRDGMMQGPNFAATKRLIDKTQMDIIGSGGVSSISDLLKLQEIGCAGAILGRAMYEGAFTVPNALEAIQTADKGE